MKISIRTKRSRSELKEEEQDRGEKKADKMSIAVILSVAQGSSGERKKKKKTVRGTEEKVADGRKGKG